MNVRDVTGNELATTFWDVRIVSSKTPIREIVCHVLATESCTCRVMERWLVDGYISEGVEILKI